MRSPLRILLTDGSSLSARQTITALGRCGYSLDVCDPNPLCTSRFSRFVRRVYRCPPLGTDPLGYLAFMLAHLCRERYDVLLPVRDYAAIACWQSFWGRPIMGQRGEIFCASSWRTWRAVASSRTAGKI
jgi:hypothetical protein